MKTLTRKTVLLCLFIIALCSLSYAQQKVDASALNKSYSGGYFRTNLGIAMGNVSLGTDISSSSIACMHFHFEPGRRINRKIAAYAFLTGNVMMVEDNYISDFVQASIGLGTHLYLSNPNLYISPELGLAIVDINDHLCLGPAASIKTGFDLYIKKNSFLGLGAFYTIFMGTEADSASKTNGSVIGAYASLKVGK